MNGINHLGMNATNKFILLKHLATQGPLSRVELSNLSGLSKMTITAIMNEYLALGVVQPCGSAVSTGGRKPELLEIAPTALLTLGISIGRDVLQAGIINLRGEILESERIPFSSITNRAVFIDGILYLCDAMLRNKYAKNIWGIGISSVGPLSAESGVLLNPPDFNGISDVPLSGALRERYALPVHLQIDMCVAALAETYFGNKKQYDNFLYIGVSSGIGGGVIIDRKLYTGTIGLAGVIGHTIVERGGLPCECGQRGCLEMYSSTKAILQWAREQSGNEKLSWLELTNGVAEGNALSLRAMERMTDFLGMAITNFQMAFDLQGILIGGDLYHARDHIVEGIRRQMQSGELTWTLRRSVNVEASTFASNASFIGTSALVMENSLEAMR